jgi:acyl-CoA synthetase (AMP-forming)/AMP-acid ligase II
VNLYMLLEMALEGAGDRVLVGSRHGGLTAEQLDRLVRRAAFRFTRSPASHVGLIDVNSEAVPIALLGAALAGLPFAPINYRLTDQELRAIVDSISPAVILAGADSLGRVSGMDGIEVIARRDLVSAADVSDEPPPVDAGATDPDAVAVILFTSGTTGLPKAALLRHRHLLSYVIGTTEFMSAGEDEAQLVSVPPYHIAGVSTILTSLFSGRRVVYLPSFDAASWVHLAIEERVTHAMVVPTMLGRVLDVLEAHAVTLDSLRHLSYGGGRMPLETIERAMALLPQVDFVNAYGLTETSSTIAVLGPDDHRTAVASRDPARRARLRSVGRPAPTVELEIRDPRGAVVPAGERGEIYVRGEQIAGEYLGRSLLTDDGWFPTNDAGYLDDAGFLFLDGRLDDVIVRGAENLSPVEIEDVLMAHDGVAAAAVVGVPDHEWGEVVAAVVVRANGARVTAKELQDWVRVRLRSARTPQVIEFRDDLPHNESGKLLRRVLREELTHTP